MCNFAHSFANQFNFYIMKRISMFFVGLAMIAFTACSTLSNSASTNTAAMLSGQQCAAAITTLYNSYKALGKIDLTNAANLSSALIVATCYTQLKANKGDANYRQAFTAGAISAGTSAITSTNADAFTTALLGASGLTGLNSQTATNTQTTTSSSTALTNIMKSLH